MSLAEKRVVIDYKACSTCTQCIAICPEKALSWDRVLPVDFEPALMPSLPQLEELLGERRTIRAFTDERVDRKTIGNYSAPGGKVPDKC